MKRTDGEGSSEVGVHCAGVVAGEDSKTVYVVRCTDFFSWLEVVDEVTRGNDGRLVVVCGGNMLSHAMKVSFVGSWAMLQVFCNVCGCEPWNRL